MTGEELYEVLTKKGCHKLFHANSVRTSISLLKLGGIASRGKVEEQGFPQTKQISDDEDKGYGIWNDSFLDTHDIHGALKRRNFYGPVLFVMTARVLLNLPAGSTVRVARCNPTKWAGLTDAQRYFMTRRDLEADMKVGYFDHMVMVRSPTGILQFNDSLERIILDEPRLNEPQVGEEYSVAKNKIEKASAEAGLNVKVERRICYFCKCATDYQEKHTRIPYFYTP